MAIPLPDARELSPEVLEALRLRALRACALGFTETPDRGVSRRLPGNGLTLVVGLCPRRFGRPPPRAAGTALRFGPCPHGRAGRPRPAPAADAQSRGTGH